MAERKVVKIHTILLGGSLKPVLLDSLERPCGDADADKLVALFPPHFACLEVHFLSSVSVSVGFRHVHSLAILASAGKIAFPLAHYEPLQPTGAL